MKYKGAHDNAVRDSGILATTSNIWAEVFDCKLFLLPTFLMLEFVYKFVMAHRDQREKYLRTGAGNNNAVGWIIPKAAFLNIDPVIIDMDPDTEREFMQKIEVSELGN